LFDDALRSTRRFSARRRDADCLNLRGVIDEASTIGKAAMVRQGDLADRSHAAAQQNMRRMYEMSTFGSCREMVALGDERPALFELLRERESTSTEAGGRS
jgi:hypothetical protein